MKKKVSDIIAEFIKKKQVKHVFGIIGSANAHIFDSIHNLKYTEVVCNHHEQASTMAIQTYYRISEKVSFAIVTAGAGSSNAITGVISAWADSIPGIILSANENSNYTRENNPLRMWGIQGFDIIQMVSKITKYSTRILEPKKILYELEKAYFLSLQGRPGPCWIDIPMNIQSALVEESELEIFYQNTTIQNNLNLDPDDLVDDKICQIVNLLKTSKRPVFWLGNGIRLSNSVYLLHEMLEKIKVPFLLSWAGIDMIDSNHPLVFGRAGVYGLRYSNLVLQNCDLLITIGTRLSLSQIGYDQSELARAAKIITIDIDKTELEKIQSRDTEKICTDAGVFIKKLLSQITKPINDKEDWLNICNEYRNKYPISGPEHKDEEGFINSYKFIDRLNDFLKPNQVIVTDMGTGLLSGHQALKIKQGQRLMTSTGLGEMGYGLPAAIGASFARNKGEVLCLNTDGGMMMNLQELQTIVHHKLPIKIFIFCNDGYLMIKHTQKAILQGRHFAVSKENGVSCPNFINLAKAFDIDSYQIKTWNDFDEFIPKIQESKKTLICEIQMHPFQLFIPKLSLAMKEDGTLISPPLEDLYPFIPREELQKNMIVEILKKSKEISS